MKTYTINKIGMSFIRGFLAQVHQRGFEFTEDQIKAWGHDACREMYKGNNPRLTVNKYDSNIGVECSAVIPINGIEVGSD